jgi:hypothetical protein
MQHALASCLGAAGSYLMPAPVAPGTLPSSWYDIAPDTSAQINVKGNRLHGEAGCCCLLQLNMFRCSGGAS